jgi:hypothetical protein
MEFGRRECPFSTPKDIISSVSRKQLMAASLRAGIAIFGDLRQFDVQSFGVPLGAGDPKPTKAGARPARGQDREQEAENKG